MYNIIETHSASLLLVISLLLAISSGTSECWSSVLEGVVFGLLNDWRGSEKRYNLRSFFIAQRRHAASAQRTETPLFDGVLMRPIRCDAVSLMTRNPG